MVVVVVVVSSHTLRACKAELFEIAAILLPDKSALNPAAKERKKLELRRYVGYGAA
jgi:hypothetical protein